MLVDWGGVERPAYVVADVNEPGLVEAMRDLTLVSKQFREAVKAGLKLAPLTAQPMDHGHKFSPEFSGTKTFTTKEQVTARVEHGKVVKALRDALESKGIEVFNDMNRDLYSTDADGAIRALFEAKTASGTGSLYEAIGQLFYHSDDGATRVAVMPDDISQPKSLRLEKLGIRLLTYTWSKSGAVKFNDLDKLASDLQP